MGKACFCGLVVIELCSMGGIAECGVSVDTKTSPRRVAIEKAQEELRQEYDVREERRRELEFLEKGGNPLDFKLGHVASLSVQSTSVTDQIAEQNVISEAKGSFAFATSPHGDSVESSGKPGNSLCREGNTADNLMLLDGDASNIGGEKIVKCGTKRTNAAQAEQFMLCDGQNNAKEEDSGLFRLGPKSQAYARRRSKSTRENANGGFVKHPPIHPLNSQQKDVAGLIPEDKTEDNGVSSIGDSKPTSPNCKNVLKNASLLNDKADMETDKVQTIQEGNQTSKNELSDSNNGSQAMGISPNSVPDNSLLTVGDQMATAIASAESQDVISKESASRIVCSLPSVSNEILEEAQTPEKTSNSPSIVSVVDIHPDGMDNNYAVPHSAMKSASLNENEIDPTHAYATKVVNEHPDQNENLVPMNVDEMVDEGLNNILPSDNDNKKDGELEVSSLAVGLDDSCTPTKPELSNSLCVKDETEVCNNAVEAQNNTEQLATCNQEKGNKEECKDSVNNLNESTVAQNLASVAVPPGSLTVDVTNFVKDDADKSSRDQENIANKECEDSMVAKKDHEDAILRRARYIEANIKRAGERSLCNISLEKNRKSHWDFVLEEMVWMANDFAQERLWKNAVAAQVSHLISSSGRAVFEETSIQRKQMTVARVLSNGIMNFWRSIDALRANGGMPKPMEIEQPNELEEKKQVGVKTGKQEDEESLGQEKSHQRPIQSYALRLLEYNINASECLSLAEAPPTPDRLNDFGILKVPDQLSEANLFYGVQPGAMQAYRESVERVFVYNKKIGNTVLKDDYEPSTYASVTDVPMENAYGDEEGVARMYMLPGAYDGGLASKISHKKKHSLPQRMNGTRPYEFGADMPYDAQYLESKPGTQQLLSNSKRTTEFPSVPIKRIRTAVRQRVVSPFPAGASGTPQFTNKTDASSGDTNSCQDDQSSLHGGSFSRKNADIESTVDFDRQLLYDGSEVSTKSKKKKKSKHSGYKTPQNVSESCSLMAPGKGTYDPRSQVDMITQYEQDYRKKRLETHQFDSNRNFVVNGQHAGKKPKLTNPVTDTLLEALAPVGPMASPAASQMSNMENTKKANRGKKTKGLKMATGHSGPGSPWSCFEDQTLVVLVHDMGENWELVSDALNSIIQLKCIYKRPNECKERHKLLTDKSSGDGADSADDSGSSQHYPASLPGIPKGSARQLFQRLQVPFEEETIRTHFEKIIFLGQKLHQTRRKGEIQELRQINPLHTSHVFALSQACPGNLSGVIFTPLDLCDGPSNSDALSIGYPGSHTSGLALPNNHCSIGPTHPASNVNSRLPGSPGMILGSNSPLPLNATFRDAQRYAVPRPTSLHGDEQSRIHYNQMVNGRNIHQPGVPVPGVLPSGVDRGARMMPPTHGVGMMTGLNRGTPVSRPGFPRLGSSGMANVGSPGNMSPNNGQGLQNTVNVHPGAIPGPGSTMLRPREPMQMLRPGQNSEDHRQMMMPEFQLQVSQGNNHAVHFSSPPFSNAGPSSPLQSFPGQQSQPHQMPQQPHIYGNTHLSHSQGTNQSSPQQQQAYAMRLAKERHIQQMMPQQQCSLSGASAVPTVQNSSQMQQQSQGSAAGDISASQPQHKQQHPSQNPLGNPILPHQPSATTSHKQKKQQGQQQPRQNQQQRNQGSQQAKLMKSLGRGNMMHPSPVDVTQAGVIPTACKNQVPDKNVMQQGPGNFVGSKGSMPSIPQPGGQPKVYTSQMPLSPMQTPDISNPGTVKASSNHTLLTSQQGPLHSPSQLPQQPQQVRYMGPSQNNIQRLMMQQNRHMNTDGRIELPGDQVQHNQVMSSASLARSTDSGSPGISSISHRKQESSHDPGAVTSTSQLTSSPQDTFVGNDKLLPSSSQSMLQRQMSGGVPIHGHSIGGQLQQQSRQQLQSQQRPVVQGSVYAHPSNTGPG